jgi:hypothetical protein
MSKPDIRAIVELHLDFIVQNSSVTPGSTEQCHFTDGWGASSSDPKGQEGLQDCFLDRYQLCAQQVPPGSLDPFDLSVCLFRNQKETDTLNDNMKRFNATLQYCSEVTGFDHAGLLSCAQSPHGRQLLAASHAKEVKFNPHRAKGQIKSVPPQWIAINGKDTPSSDDWLSHICNAYTGSPKPSSCASATVV